MSHDVEQKVAFKDKSALQKACKSLGYPFTEGRRAVKTYSGRVEGDFIVQLPGWKYEAAIDTQKGTIGYDNYNGQWGDELHLENLNQEYNLVVREQWAEGEGYYTERIQQGNGHIHLEITGAR